jgi:hypothetical protein
MKHFLVAFNIAILSLSLHAQVGVGTTSPNSTLDVRGSVAAATRSFTGATTLTTADHTLIFTGSSAVTATLPDASACAGREYCIKNFSTTTPAPVLTIAAVSSQTIDKASTWLLNETNEAVTLVSDGSNWAVANQGASAASGGSWNEGGNGVSSMQSLGTTTNFSLPFITNNTERMRITNAGNVGIGSTSFSSNPEALLVYQNSSTSFNVIGGKGNLNNYLQLNIQNQSGGNAASSDLVATANNGNETTNYVDLGINSSGYNQSGILGGHNLCYLYAAGADFAIGNSVSGQNLLFFVDGTATANEAMRIATGGNVGIGTTNPLASLDVAGTVKIGTAGTPLNSVIRFTNQSITDNTTFTNNQTRTETFTLSGVSQFASVEVNPRSALPAGVIIAYSYASATNTVTVGFANATGSPVSIGTIAFDFKITQ